MIIITFLIMIQMMIGGVMQCFAVRDSDRWLLFLLIIRPSSFLVASIVIVIIMIIRSMNIMRLIFSLPFDHHALLVASIIMISLITLITRSMIIIMLMFFLSSFWSSNIHPSSWQVHHLHHHVNVHGNLDKSKWQWWWWRPNDGHKDTSLFHTSASIYWCCRSAAWWVPSVFG